MKKSLVLFVALFGLVACSPAFTFEVITPPPAATYTPWAEGTQMALASPTPWVAGTQTALAVPTLTPFTEAFMERPTDFSPVVYGGKFYGTTSFILLGGVSQGEWMAPEMSAARFAGEATYSLHSLAYANHYFVWGKAPEFSPICRSYSIGTDAGLDETGFVGVLDGWEISKRGVTELSPDGEFSGRPYSTG